MDNSRPHTAAATKQFLDRRGVPLVSQSPYSHDLNLLDRFLFRHIKMDLRGEDFSGPEDLSKAMQRSIEHISENTLVEELKKLKSHLDDVIALRLQGIIFLKSIKSFIYFIYHCVLLVYLQSLSDALLLIAVIHSSYFLSCIYHHAQIIIRYIIHLLY